VRDLLCHVVVHCAVSVIGGIRAHYNFTYQTNPICSLNTVDEGKQFCNQHICLYRSFLTLIVGLNFGHKKGNDCGFHWL